MNSDPIAALEIGSSRTVLAIGEPLGPDRVKITAVGTIPSTGVRKSRILDIQQASYSVASVLKHVKSEFGYSIGQACLAVSGSAVKATPVTTSWQIEGKQVTNDDLTGIYNRSFENGIDPVDRTLLDCSELGYGLDNEEGVSPLGMSGRLLKMYSLFIHGSTARIADAKAAAASAKLEISECYFAGSCAAMAVLSQSDKASGTLVIDLGGGSTVFSVWAEGRMRYASVLGVGGYHVTNDIRTAFTCQFSAAEALKTSYASATLGAEGSEGRVEVPSSSQTSNAPVTVSRRALDTVVNARMYETLTVVKDEIDKAGLLHLLGAGVVLTGGGAAMRNITTLAETVFGLPVRIGTFAPGIECDDAGIDQASLATAAGMILASHLGSESPQSLFDPVKRIFGRIFK